MKKQDIQCKPSEYGLKQVHAMRRYSIGTITSESKDMKCWYVLWENNKTKIPYHKSLIDILEPSN